MKIVRIQDIPHPIFEVQEYEGSKDFSAIIAWLHKSSELPQDMSFSFKGTMFRFRTEYERLQWALGFDKAFDLLDDEGEPKPFTRCADPACGSQNIKPVDARAPRDDGGTLTVRVIYRCGSCQKRTCLELGAEGRFVWSLLP